MLSVAIGVQARSTSERLPGKSSMQISGKSVVARTLKACHNAASYISNKKGSNIAVDVFLLVPEGDELVSRHQHEKIIQGPEHDVLARYEMLMEENPRDYYVRITADCPMIPPYLITKHVVTACNYTFDYTANVDPEVRTHPDGHDAEVLSAPLLRWICDNAKSDFDREHVTTILRENSPAWARKAAIVGYLDNSALKISVDTKEDLDFVKTYHDVLDDKMKRAKEKYNGVFRA